jgi:hypothetical protein
VTDAVHSPAEQVVAALAAWVAHTDNPDHHTGRNLIARATIELICEQQMLEDSHDRHPSARAQRGLHIHRGGM